MKLAVRVAYAVHDQFGRPTPIDAVLAHVVPPSLRRPRFDIVSCLPATPSKSITGYNVIMKELKAQDAAGTLSQAGREMLSRYEDMRRRIGAARGTAEAETLKNLRAKRDAGDAQLKEEEAGRLRRKEDGIRRGGKARADALPPGGGGGRWTAAELQALAEEFAAYKARNGGAHPPHTGARGHEEAWQAIGMLL